MSDTIVVKSLITPLDQTLRIVFSAQRSYYIDIYQREYKWTEKNVQTLLNDIEVRFLQHERRETKPQDIQKDVLDRFEPYFLNTYLTHTTATSTSIVDGQQRLTTLLLILIKLYRVLKTVEEDPANRGRTFSSDALRNLIFETNDFGEAERFKIFNENREDAFRALIDGREINPCDETRKRLNANYQSISRHLDTFLIQDGTDRIDLAKLTYYLTYLLDRVSIVEIRIERQDNVAMIFEVVNDRGLGLKPYEILKGKLIGGLPTSQKESANQVWTELQEKYFAAELRNTIEKTIDLDTFFRTYFRAKFADTEKDYEKFESDYHYEIYRHPKIRRYFGDFKDHDLLFRRITDDFRYFAELYFRLRTGYDDEFVVFNKLLDQNQQYLLLLSALDRHDPLESAKIRAIARKFDQIHVILRLLDAYDSNAFQRLIYPLNAAIRGKSISEATAEFDKALIHTLTATGTIANGRYEQAKDLIEYERFKGVSNRWLNFSKYVLMRIDRHLSQLLDKPSFVGSDLSTLEARFNRTGTRVYALHLEHIYTQHPKNKALFTINGAFDENAFHQTRNLLGMVLLLKDKHNLSSGDEVFSSKRSTYEKSNLIWNELLVGHLANTDTQSLPPELRLQPVIPTPEGVFPREGIESRQRAIFDAIKMIWGSF